jgi:hypothetical protein
MDAAALKAALHDGKEIALLDAREEVPYSYRHLLMAACVPLSRLEMLVDACVPRRSCQPRRLAHERAGLFGRIGIARRHICLGIRGLSHL